MDEMSKGGSASGIRVERNARAATIWLDKQAKRNAFDLPMLHGLTDVALSVAHDETIASVVLRGAGGRAFSAGADFDAFSAPSREAFSARFAAMENALNCAAEALLQLPMPLVAALEGPCFGGAVQLALCADLRIASESLRLSIPAGAIGLVYPLDAIERVVALMGPSATKLFLMTGRELSASECWRAGLVEAVIPEQGFEEALSEVCGRLERSSPGALRAYKRIVNGIVRQDNRDELKGLQSAVNSSEETWRRMSSLLAGRAK